SFIPVEIYKHYLLTNLQKRTSQCQRCFLYYKYTNDISHCEVNEQVYKDILTEIKRKHAVIILIVDLLDIPNSISGSWTHLADQITDNHNSSANIIFILGNKVDLLPKDRLFFRIKNSLFLHKSSLGNFLYMCAKKPASSEDVSLTSASFPPSFLALTPPIHKK
ncbi:unnamed protein product, partial [Rotaria sp. Silwood2]